jgi:hypothetical protein
MGGMKQFIRKEWTILLAILLIVFAFASYDRNGYFKEEPYQVTFVDKLIIPGGYKSRGYLEAVVRLDNGDVVSTRVSPATYVMLEKGGRYEFMFSKAEIDPDEWEKFIALGISAISFFAGFMLGFCRILLLFMNYS